MTRNISSTPAKLFDIAPTAVSGSRPQSHALWVPSISKNEAIASIVKMAVKTFASEYKTRLIKDVDNPDGVINRKRHNVFLHTVDRDYSYNSAISRSFESAFGQLIEKMALDLARLSYHVETSVEGVLYPKQNAKIAELLEGYKNPNNPLTPQISHYDDVDRAKSAPNFKLQVKKHCSDMYLIDKAAACHIHHLIELKAGGDLDTKKARSEKEAMLEQRTLLRNTLGPTAIIETHFATAYNSFGEDAKWNQKSVLQFFAKEELLIGKDFWNFICKSEDGYSIVLKTFLEHAPLIAGALADIKQVYLG